MIWDVVLSLFSFTGNFPAVSYSVKLSVEWAKLVPTILMFESFTPDWRSCTVRALEGVWIAYSNTVVPMLCNTTSESWIDSFCHTVFPKDKHFSRSFILKRYWKEDLKSFGCLGFVFITGGQFLFAGLFSHAVRKIASKFYLKFGVGLLWLFVYNIILSGISRKTFVSFLWQMYHFYYALFSRLLFWSIKRWYNF